MTMLKANKHVNRRTVVKRGEMETCCIKWSSHIEKQQRHCLRQQVPYHPGSQITATLFRAALELLSLPAIASQGGCCICENILSKSEICRCVCVEGKDFFFFFGRFRRPQFLLSFWKQTGAEILIM